MLKKLFLLSSVLTAVCLSAAPAIVKVSSYKPDKNDATAAFQKAIASGAAEVIVDDPGFPYIVRPLRLRSNLKLTFRNGVVVRAKKGEFKKLTESLFKTSSAENIVMQGEGKVILEMNKEDYDNPKLYKKSEWRHGICFLDCSNVVIRNLTVRKTGGDGLYLGTYKLNGGCRNVLVENCIFDENYRQGISVISAEKLTIRNCKMLNTSGTPPACGIDFEPNKPHNFLVDCLVENCEIAGNKASGTFCHLMMLNAKSRPVSITFKNCKLTNNSAGFGFTMGSVKGNITVKDCTGSGNPGYFLRFSNQEGGVRVAVENCTFTMPKDFEPIIINSGAQQNTGNIFLKNVKIIGKFPAMVFYTGGSGIGVVSSRFDILYSRDGKKFKAFNSEAFLKKYKPDPALRKSLKIQPFDLKKLQAAGQKSKGDLSPLTFRGSASFLQAVPGAGVYPIRFKLNQLGKRVLKMSITLKDKNQTIVEKRTFTGKKDIVYDLKATGKGVYTMDINAYGNTFNIYSSTPGNALVADREVPLFRGGNKRLYFTVPAAAKDVNLEISGSQREYVSVNLLNAKGHKVFNAEKITSPRIISVKRTPTAQDEVWQLHIIYAVEDHMLRLGAPSLPLFYASPENRLIQK